jgi:hypothetical protein
MFELLNSLWARGTAAWWSRRLLTLATVTLALAMAPCANGLETSDYAVQVSAQAAATPLRITLSWAPDSAGTATRYVVSRKGRADQEWNSSVTLPASATSYSDTEIAPGEPYEYQVERIASDHHAFGYVYAGLEVPAVESRGRVVLIVEKSPAGALDRELSRLEEDLTGDGWIVLRHDVARTDPVESVKALIKGDYLADPAQTRCVFLFGAVPVPYSGKMAPDGHTRNHFGAWPADLFYGEMTSDWSDTRVNSTRGATPRQVNVPGDGKFDPTQIPGLVRLAVGRVDLGNLPAFALPENELLRRYLDKDHAFRHKTMEVERAALLVDAFGISNDEAFAAGGWRNFAPLVGADNVETAAPGRFIEAAAGRSYLWAYGCGPGTYTSAAGIGATTDLATADVRAVFTMLFGSYFGDWDSKDNFLRAALASPGNVLTASWAGRPHWFHHHMGLGEPICTSVLASQNNAGTYQPMNYGTLQTHIALMGDPTLRMHPVSPPSAFVAKAAGTSVSLEWLPSGEPVLGYHIYRAQSVAGPFVRINSDRIEDTRFVDPTPDPKGDVYQVRSEKLETSPSGSYYNLSQAAFVTARTPDLLVRQR